MVNQDLLTVFVALTAVAVLLQTGILIGMYVLTNKISSQLDRATEHARSLLGPAVSLTEQLQSVTARMAEHGLSTQVKLRQLERTLDENEIAWHEKLNEWGKRTA